MAKRPLCLSDALTELCRRWGIETKVKEYLAMSRWPQVVGEKIAREAKPIGIEKGKLFVQVDNSSWRNELTFIKKDIVDKLNQAVGTPVIRDVIFSSRKGVK